MPIDVFIAHQIDSHPPSVYPRKISWVRNYSARYWFHGALKKFDLHYSVKRAFFCGAVESKACARIRDPTDFSRFIVDSL